MHAQAVPSRQAPRRLPDKAIVTHEQRHLVLQRDSEARSHYHSGSYVAIRMTTNRPAFQTVPVDSLIQMPGAAQRENANPKTEGTMRSQFRCLQQSAEAV